jgi:hypothetical protein
MAIAGGGSALVEARINSWHSIGVPKRRKGRAAVVLVVVVRMRRQVNVVLRLWARTTKVYVHDFDRKRVA